MAISYNAGLPLDTDSEAVRTYPASGAEHVDTTNRVAVVEQGQFDYETVAVSQADQVLGVTGAAGDFLHKLIITVGTAATAAVSIKDGGGSAIPILPNSPGGGIGVYVVEINAVSTAGAWKVTTGAGSTVLAIGRFTA
jgi:hypothetical protein